MAVASRVFRRYLDQSTARRVVARLFWAMSRDQAKRVLNLRGEPSEDEVNQAYRARVHETIRKPGGVAGNEAELKDLNIAKDTLRGQFDRKDPGSGAPNAPEGPGRSQGRPPPPPREEEPPMPPPPPPDGEPFAAALHGLGNVDWKIATEGKGGSEPIYEEGFEPGNRKLYWLETDVFILVGRTDSHWVFAKLERRMHTRKDHRDKTVLVRWVAEKVTQPADKDLLKVGPKVIKGLREGAYRNARYAVIEGTLTEDNIAKKVRQSRLLFPDAVLGSGILGEGAPEPAGRKVQVELEPVLNREKYKAVQAAGTRDWHLAYDWFVHLNGKKSQLNDGEVDALSKTHLFIGVFGYDYSKGKKNLTKLRGSRFKMGPSFALRELARALDPGPTKDAVQRAADSFPEAK